MDNRLSCCVWFDYPAVSGWYWVEVFLHDRVIVYLPANESDFGGIEIDGRYFTSSDIVLYTGPIAEPVDERNDSTGIEKQSEL